MDGGGKRERDTRLHRRKTKIGNFRLPTSGLESEALSGGGSITHSSSTRYLATRAALFSL